MKSAFPFVIAIFLVLIAATFFINIQVLPYALSKGTWNSNLNHRPINVEMLTSHTLKNICFTGEREASRSSPFNARVNYIECCRERMNHTSRRETHVSIIIYTSTAEPAIIYLSEMITASRSMDKRYRVFIRMYHRR